MNKIYKGNTLDLMATMEDESVDMVLTDTPFGMDLVMNRRTRQEKHKKILNDTGPTFQPLIKDYIKECHRIMKPDTAIYMFCNRHCVGFFQEELEKYFWMKNLLVWVKNNHGIGDLKASYAPKHEMIWYAHKGRCLRTEGESRVPDVLEYSKVYKGKHPTMKPVDMLRLFIRQSSQPGDVIFDGFMGSGSTAVAALLEGRDYLGAELDEGYHNMAVKRVENVNSK